MNKVILVGNVGQEPQLRYTPAGIPVCDFSMATNERWVGGDGQQHERTTWVRVTCWRRQAEVIAEYLTKGRQICVEGKMGDLQPWTDRDGNPRCTHEVTASSVEFLGAPVAISNDDHPYEAESGAGTDFHNDDTDERHDIDEEDDDEEDHHEDDDYDDTDDDTDDEPEMDLQAHHTTATPDQAAAEPDDNEEVAERDTLIARIEEYITTIRPLNREILSRKFTSERTKALFDAFVSNIYKTTRDWAIAELSIDDMKNICDAYLDMPVITDEAQATPEPEPVESTASKPSPPKRTRKAAPKAQPSLAAVAAAPLPNGSALNGSTPNGSTPSSAYPQIDDADIPF